MLVEIAKTMIVLFGGILAVAFFAAAYKVAISDKNAYRRNQERAGSIMNSILGRCTVRAFHGGARDSVVAAGLAINKRNNAWVEQGALSEEAIHSILY